MISIVVAQAHNRVIGKKNDLPWYLPADLKHFKELTAGHTVIMGRKTFDSIYARLGGPLPNRKNIIITRDKNFTAKGAIITHSLKDALQAATDKEVFIIGGAQIFEQAMPYVERVHLTQVDAEITGDVYMPELHPEEWRQIAMQKHQKDEKNPYDYSFLTLARM